jgi:hypothetical protein
VTQPTTSSDGLKAAMSALLRGDAAERDRLVERTKRLLEAEDYAARIERVLSVDFYVRADGVAISTVAMAKTVGVMQ